QQAVAQRLAAWTGDFTPSIVAALDYAALHHDEGKADPRQQADFQGGDQSFAAVQIKAGRLLAKPRVKPPQNRSLPRGCRHEFASVAIAAGLPEILNICERDLALSVIGSHHGRGRAVLIPHEDPNPTTFERLGVRVSSLHEWLTLGGGW